MADANYTLQINTGSSLNTISQLETKVSELSASLKDCAVGSKEFADTSKELNKYQTQLDALNQTTDQMGTNIAKASAGIVGGFQAAQGALALFGVESESVTRSIQKMQALMSMSGGIKNLTDGIKSFKTLSASINMGTKALSGFKKGLIATGLGALVVVLGSIIANWDEFTKAIGVSEEQLKKFSQVIGGVTNVAQTAIKGLATSFGKLFKGDFSGALDAIKAGFDVTKAYNEGVQNKIAEQTKEAAEKASASWDEYVKKRNEQLDTEASKVKATIDDETKQREELLRIEKERLKLYTEGTKAYYDQLLKVKELSKTDEEAAEETEPEPVIDPKQVEKDMQLIADIKTRQREAAMEEEALELERLQAKYETEKSLLIQYNEDTTALTEEYESSKTAIQAKYQKQRDDAQKAELQAQRQGAMTLISGFADSLGKIADLIGDESEEAFEASKAFQISSVVLSTITGAIQAYIGASTNPGLNAIPVVGPILAQAMGITNAGIIAAAGAIEIANISKTKFGDKNVNSSVAGGGGAAATPSASSVSSTLIAPTEYSEAVQGARLEERVGDTRVYVTEGDIRSTTRKVDVAESESRY